MNEAVRRANLYDLFNRMAIRNYFGLSSCLLKKDLQISAVLTKIALKTN